MSPHVVCTIVFEHHVPSGVASSGCLIEGTRLTVSSAYAKVKHDPPFTRVLVSNHADIRWKMRLVAQDEGVEWCYAWDGAAVEALKVARALR